MQSFKMLLAYIKPYWFLALIGPLLMFVEVAMDLLQPTIMQHMIDGGIANGDTGLTVRMGLLMIGTAIIGLIGGIGCSIYSTRAAVHFSTDLRKDVFRKIEKFSSENVDRFGTGKLITIVTNDITSLQRAVMLTLKIFVRGPLLFIGSIVIVFFTARELFPILAVAVPILIVIIIFFTRKSGVLFKAVQEAIDRVNTRLQENLAGMRVVKAFGRQGFEKGKFAGANDNLTKVNISAEQLLALMMPILLFVVNVGIVAALWLGAIKVDNGAIQVGVILAFINYLTIIMNGLMSSSHVLMMITRAFPSADRVQEVLTAKIDIEDVPEEGEGKRISGDLDFQNVYYSYSKNGEYVLKGLSFKVKKGETLGVIGSTGSGKSTLSKLVPRLFDVDSGRILIDGRDIKDYRLADLRAGIGVVTQRATLFSGTIKSNVLDGKPDAIAGEIEAATDAACASEFIHRFDDGADHSISQGGHNLSGGQRQRISMARAFVRKPSILILDDSTSAVDALSESAIQSTLRERYSDSTKLIISSKISSIKEANQIIVLEDGEIVGRGTHEELLKTSFVYQEIYVTQGGTVG
ncbi:ABC transporter ATP-binding protein [Cytobacillus purgationiresistens]|uniref:ATP-binding cassette subfamily B protein n=1 Tax=Cytobacillus purgationiresistens TaxID=863449 RepID=A0ABU0APH5_9BACI|nr:ABC transporter ATP-binding protein [Cytobacillus purgationiresistens]MDQ0272764.1 ATP-binding cassette subfamily B protein [Cytobacillus purgationiresistens]